MLAHAPNKAESNAAETNCKKVVEICGNL